MSVAVAEGEPAIPVLADTTNSLRTTPEPSKQEEVVDLANGKEPIVEAHAVDEPADVAEVAPPAEEEADGSALSVEPVALVNGAKDAVHENGEVRVLLLALRSYVAHPHVHPASIARCSQATVVNEPKIDAEAAAADGDGDASHAVPAAKGDLAPNGHAPHHVSALFISSSLTRRRPCD